MKIHIRSSQDLGELIGSARRRRGLSQRDVAKELGVTQAWISRVERGNQKCWIGQVLRLASFLDVNLVGELSTDDKSETQAQGEYPDLDAFLNES
ncbi:MAG: helix-turn-helix transcriptional regulator [Verrucomicrobia bacterium]|nr:helix-turn-helix transcriptional regulator [Verrucomicrobiota bacterium]